MASKKYRSCPTCGNVTEDRKGVGRDKSGSIKYMRGASLGGPRLEGKATPVTNAAGMRGVSDPKTKSGKVKGASKFSRG